MTALTCILGPMSLPVGPVPVSLTNLCVFMSVYVLGWKMGFVSCAGYIMLGAMGLPVFSGFSGGIAKLLGPTGGYIIGFLPMAIIVGLFAQKTKNRALQFFGLVVATALCYGLGTAWYCFQAQCQLLPALSLCVFPFIPVDLFKIFMAVSAGPYLKERLNQAGVGQI